MRFLVHTQTSSWGIIPPSMPKRGLDRLFTYALIEIFAESPLEEPIEVCQEHQEHYEEYKKQILLPPRDY